MGVRVDEMAHIGDSLNFDLLASQKAGLISFYLNRSHKPETPPSLSNLIDLNDEFFKF